MNAACDIILQPADIFIHSFVSKYIGLLGVQIIGGIHDRRWISTYSVELD